MSQPDSFYQVSCHLDFRFRRSSKLILKIVAVAKSEKHIAVFFLYVQVTLILPTKFRISRPFSSGQAECAVAHWWARSPLGLKVRWSIQRVCKWLSLSEYAFFHVICRDDMKTVCRPSVLALTRGTYAWKSSLVHVKEPYSNSKWLLLGLQLKTRSAGSVREDIRQYEEKEKESS